MAGHPPSSSELSRRDFLAIAAAGAAAATLPSPAGAQPAPQRTTTGAPPNAAGSTDDVAERSIDDLQAAMASGQLTARALTEQYLARIAAMDQAGPALAAMIELNPDALSIADTLDAERKAGHVRGPLHGIPIAIKDNIDTADRMHTSAGSLALAGQIASRDSFVAERLRAAGAIIIGKTNLSEWANFRSTHPSSGWSGRGGQARNPYALDRNTSGSSSGSGAAAAASYCAAAVGTETDGSVTSPAAAMSLVGLKPTLGLVSRSGIVPIAHSQDTAGPMARTVRDAAILLGAMTGVDPRDRATAASRSRMRTDYVSALDAGALRGARLGVVREKHMGYSPKTDRVMEQAIVALKDAGAIVVDPANIATSGKYDDDEFQVLLYEFKADLNAYLATAGPGASVRTMAQLIDFNERNAAREMPYFGQEILEMSQKKGPLTSREYVRARARCVRMSRTEGIDATLRTHHLDALIAPTQGPIWLTDLVNGDAGGYAGFTTPAAVAGYPNVTVPMGYVEGLPVGLSFVGAAWRDATLLRFAYAFEQATKVRRPPTYAQHASV